MTLRLEILTEDIQADHLPDGPPPDAVVSVADVVAAVGPGDVLHDELLPGDGEIGAKAPGEGEIVLKYFLVNIFSNDPIPLPSVADMSQICGVSHRRPAHSQQTFIKRSDAETTRTYRECCSSQ